NVVMVLQPWTNPIPLQRAWCVFELFAAHQSGAKFHVTLSTKELRSLLDGLHRDPSLFLKVLQNASCKESRAFIEQDRINIHEAIKRNVGFKQIDEMVLKQFQAWVVDRLKVVEKVGPDNVQKIRQLLYNEIEGESIDKIENEMEAARWLRALAFWRIVKGDLGKALVPVAARYNILKELFNSGRKSEEFMVEFYDSWFEYGKLLHKLGQNEEALDLLVSLQSAKQTVKAPELELMMLEALSFSVLAILAPETVFDKCRTILAKMASLKSHEEQIEDPQRYCWVPGELFASYFDAYCHIRVPVKALSDETIQFTISLYDFAEQNYADDPSSISSSFNSLLWWLEIHGRFAEMETKLISRIEALKLQVGVLLVEVSKLLRQLCELYLRQSKFDQYSDIIESQFNAYSEFANNEKHVEAILWKKEMANIYKAQGKYSDAIEVLERTKTVFGKLFVVNERLELEYVECVLLNGDPVLALKRTILCLNTSWGKELEGERYLKWKLLTAKAVLRLKKGESRGLIVLCELRQECIHMLGSSHKLTLEVIILLASTQVTFKNYKEAQEAFDFCKVRVDSVLGPYSPLTLDFYKKHESPLIPSNAPNDNNSTRFVTEMEPRDPREEGRVATPLELLFDLTLVAAISIISEEFSHMVLEGKDVNTAVFLVFATFSANWMAWMNFTWFLSAYDPDDILFRLATLGQLIGALSIATSVGPVFQLFDFRQMLYGFIFLRFFYILFYLCRAAIQDKRNRVYNTRMAFLITLLQLAWYISILYDPPTLAWNAGTFASLQFCEFFFPFLAEQRTASPGRHPHHLQERYGAFTIIVIGESFIGLSSAILSSNTGPISWESIKIATGSVLILFIMWWTYFTIPFGEMMGRSVDKMRICGYAHYFLHISIAIAASGTALMMQTGTHPDEHALSRTTAVLIFSWGVTSYLVILSIVTGALMGLCRVFFLNLGLKAVTCTILLLIATFVTPIMGTGDVLLIMCIPLIVFLAISIYITLEHQEAVESMVTLYKPMVARDPNENRKATQLEVLFDLTLVVAISITSEEFSHNVLSGHNVDSAIFLVFASFSANWNSWLNFTWFLSAYDPDDIMFRLATLGQLLGALAIATSVGPVFRLFDFRQMLYGFIFLRFFFVVFYLGRAALQDTQHRMYNIRMAVLMIILQVAWYYSILYDPPTLEWNAGTFAALLFCEFFFPFLAEQGTPSPDRHAHHLQERYGAFTIIVIGESFIGLSSAILSSNTGPISWESIKIAVGSVTILFIMWWAYFTIPFGDMMKSNRNLMRLCGYGHYVLHISIAIAASGTALMMQTGTHPDEHVLSRTTAVLIFVWAVSSYLVSLTLITGVMLGFCRVFVLNLGLKVVTCTILLLIATYVTPLMSTGDVLLILCVPTALLLPLMAVVDC
ncbi:hypothetical protein HDU99_002499, partial [Rhizoclosmatium hyalinum]